MVHYLYMAPGGEISVPERIFALTFFNGKLDMTVYMLISPRYPVQSLVFISDPMVFKKFQNRDSSPGRSASAKF